MKRWQPCCYQRVLRACGGSLANPWLQWSSGLRRSRQRKPRVAMTITGMSSHPNPGSTWRQASSCLASSVTSLQNLSGCHWRTSIHFTTRTRGWELLCACVCERDLQTWLLLDFRNYQLYKSNSDSWSPIQSSDELWKTFLNGQYEQEKLLSQVKPVLMHIWAPD